MASFALRLPQLPRLQHHERLLVALAIAASVHAVALFGLKFVAKPKPPPLPTLEVTLSQFSEKSPAHADFAAPTNQSGSGDATTRTEMTSTQASDFASDQPSPLPEQSVDSTPNNATSPLRALTVEGRHGENAPDIAHQETNAGATSATQKPYLDVAKQLATLQARLDDSTVNQAMGPRVRRITSVSTLATDEAYYTDAWRREVVQIGNLNLPADSSGKHVHGSVRMLVVINADGSLGDTQILETSGIPALDQGAMNIVRMAAPFPPFPPSMRKRMDTLEIIRTWRFQAVRGSGDGFSG